MIHALSAHWPEYLIEGALLAFFMVAACLAVIVLEHPASPARRAVASALVRRSMIGAGMGATATGLIYSPWGERSGSHMNPAFTLAFFSLGKIAPWDAVFYILAQFAGGIAGVAVCAAMWPRLMKHPSVQCAATVPGARGVPWAWCGEFILAFVLCMSALWASNHALTAPYTGFIAAALIAMFITVEAPISGMSMNPARTLGSAIPGRTFRGLWVYFTAPTLAMVLAAQAFATTGRVHCAKLNHQGGGRCIFRCEIGEMHVIPMRSGGIEGTH